MIFFLALLLLCIAVCSAIWCLFACAIIHKVFTIRADDAVLLL